jgi:hypothetical protein
MMEFLLVAKWSTILFFTILVFTWVVFQG